MANPEIHPNKLAKVHLKTAYLQTTLVELLFALESRFCNNPKNKASFDAYLEELNHIDPERIVYLKESIVEGIPDKIHQFKTTKKSRSYL